MVHIDNLEEKKLLIANYFCEKTRKELTAHEVFDMWSNWFKNDFRINGEPVFCIADNELVYRKSVKDSDEIIRKKYNRTFQDIYKWIKRAINNECHNKAYFHQELDRERRREFSRILELAKPQGFYLVLSEKDLYKNKLGRFHLVKNSKTAICGDCDKVIAYLHRNNKGKTTA